LSLGLHVTTHEIACSTDYKLWMRPSSGP
jgi:hypothetical protein